MSEVLSFADEASVDAFVGEFRERTLPKPRWTHQAHLVVGLWHLLRFPFDEALTLLRTGIKSYNEATGTPNTDEEGYHETLTVFFLHALSAHAGREMPRLELFNSLATSRLMDKVLPLAFYSRGWIMSHEARKSCVEPDLQPLGALQKLVGSQMVPSQPFYIRPAGRPDAAAFLKLVVALAKFEKLEPPDDAAQARLIEDAFGAKPRIEVWLAFADGEREAVAYAILLETYSSFLALPTLYIEDIFVLEAWRKRGIGSSLLRKTVELAHDRGCGRVEWTALDWNTNAQRVYEDKLGAKRMSEWFLYRMTEREMKDYLSRP